MKNLGYGLT